jgi:hypothetical protein
MLFGCKMRMKHELLAINRGIDACESVPGIQDVFCRF